MTVSTENTTYRDNSFYQKHYRIILYIIIGCFAVLLLMIFLVLYQVFHRPLPIFFAVSKDGRQMQLTSFEEPYLMSGILLKWASKAAVAAYTFDFVNYRKQIASVRPYFTERGWIDYQNSVANLIADITQKQLFVNGVVSGPPVISNQGPFPGKGYIWRIQLPFLVTYQSAETTSQRNFFVTMTIVKVPTDIEPQGIGIDQFLMRGQT